MVTAPTLPDYWDEQSSEICYFDSSTSALTGATFSSKKHEIAKEALLFVEGEHTDSAKRKHIFNQERLFRIVENTNNFLRSGGRVPWQQDHDKKQSSNLGDLDGEIIVRVISQADLPNPKAVHLIGKLGAFGRLIGRGARAVADITAGNIKTLSPGIDIDLDIIREISATPTPAIVGLSTFRRSDGNSQKLPTSWEDAESTEIDPEREQFDVFTERLWEIISGIRQNIAEQEHYGAILEALEGYFDRVEMLLLPEQPPGIADRVPVPSPHGRLPAPPPEEEANMSRFSIGDLLREKGLFIQNGNIVTSQRE